MFRELVSNDFGIDGEVEIVEIDENRKKYATGKITKVQIKSTDSFNSYIKSETLDSFKYYASIEDIKYWSNITGDVILVIYDSKIDTLYAKKLPDFNLKSKNGKIKSIPVVFDKEKNKLVLEDNDFINKFSNSFYDRVNYECEDFLGSNLAKFITLPKFLFEYETYFSNKREVYEELDERDVPFFTLNGNRVFTFYEINQNSFAKFHTQVIGNSNPKRYTWNDIIDDKNLRNQFSQNINLFIRSELRQQGIFYQRKYKRYYFGKDKEQDIRTVSYRTRVYSNQQQRDVVSYHTYGKDSFFRHVAFSFDFLYTKEELYLIINPKYLFTHDGFNTLEPKKITKYTNYKTSREFNNAVINQVHFIVDFLCNGKSYWKVVDHKLKIQLSTLKEFTTNFSIMGKESPKAGRNKHEENLLF